MSKIEGEQPLTKIDPEITAKLKLAGISDECIQRLAEVRQKYQAGEYRDVTQEYKRLSFARWLAEHGKLQR